MVSQINKTELQRLMQEQGVDTPPAEEKEHHKKSENKGFQIFILAAAFVYFCLLFFGKYIFPEGSEILQSMNVFSGEQPSNRLVRIASYAILTLSASQLLRIFMSRMLESRALTKHTGKALIELLSNCVKYAAVLVLAFLIMSALGVDTAEILAGLGIMSLILGLGMESLIEDVVAGIFIIAEHLYDVGDIVVADDFRGTILSIGIRSTQIEDDGGDVLIVRNSSIESLVNMTDRSSYAICDIPVNAKTPIAQVEKIIEDAHLEKLRERYPEIEKGPFYLGISEITDKGVKILTFVSVCQESTKYWIQRIMNRELAYLFDEHDIILGEGGDDDDD